MPAFHDMLGTPEDAARKIGIVPDELKRSRCVSDGRGIPELRRNAPIGLIRVKSSDAALLRRHGAYWEKGWKIDRRVDFPFFPLVDFLPEMAKECIVPYVVDAVLPNAPISRLRRLLSEESSRIVFEDLKSGVQGCEWCGDRQDLDFREIWTYDYSELHRLRPDVKPRPDIQRLDALMLLCGKCLHASMPPISGYGKPGQWMSILDRLCTIFRMDEDARSAYMQRVHKLYDFNLLHPNPPYGSGVVRREWTVDLKSLVTYHGSGKLTTKAFRTASLDDRRSLRAKIDDKLMVHRFANCHLVPEARGYSIHLG